MPDSPVISGVADLPKFYFAGGAPFRMTLNIDADFSMSGKFVAFRMRPREGRTRRIFGTDSGEANLTISSQVITANIATDDETVPAFAGGYTLADLQAKGEVEYWFDISATEGSDVLLRLQGQLDWVTAGSDIVESSAVVSSPAVDVTITSGAVSVSVAVLGASEMSAGAILTAIKTVDGPGSGLDADLLDGNEAAAFAASSHAHGNITSAGAVGSTSGLPVKTGTSGVLEAGAFGTSAGQFAEGNHTHAQLHDALTIAASLSDVLSLSTQALGAVDHGADRIVFWDESANKLTPLTVGTGLSITDTTISATGAVTSVAGRTGAVTLAQADISGLTASSTPTFGGVRIGGSDGEIIYGSGVSGYRAIWHPGSFFFLMRADSTPIFAASPFKFTIANSTLNLGDSTDNGISRISAGLLEINNGTSGEPRDLRLRGIKYNAIAISALPAAASSEGWRYEVNDANAPSVGATVASGGSAKCEVRSNGTNWIVLQIF